MISEALRSYGEDYWRNAILDTDPDTLVEWCLGNSQESCSSCSDLAAAGPITAAEFAERGLYPQSHDLECGGYHCQCFLVFIDAPITQQTVDDLLAGLGSRFGTIGDEGLSNWYDDFRIQASIPATDWTALTPLTVGKISFDAPASSRGSFKGERYGDDRPMETVGSRQWLDQPFREPSTLTATASSRGSFTGERFGDHRP
jgi:hypothetical protein